jgi:hypothetical protein
MLDLQPVLLDRRLITSSTTNSSNPRRPSLPKLSTLKDSSLALRLVISFLYSGRKISFI